MRWLLVDLVLVLVALAFLAVLSLGLWRKVKALSRTVSRAGESVAAATEALALVQADGPLAQHGDPLAQPDPRTVPGRSPTTGR